MKKSNERKNANKSTNQPTNVECRILKMWQSWETQIGTDTQNKNANVNICAFTLCARTSARKSFKIEPENCLCEISEKQRNTHHFNTVSDFIFVSVFFFFFFFFISSMFVWFSFFFFLLFSIVREIWRGPEMHVSSVAPFCFIFNLYMCMCDTAEWNKIYFVQNVHNFLLNCFFFSSSSNRFPLNFIVCKQPTKTTTVVWFVCSFSFIYFGYFLIVCTFGVVACMRVYAYVCV